jgi:hypothetical protein
MVFGYILLIIPYIICWRSRKKEFVKFRENEFALLCAAILVGSVIAWGHYLVFLFFSFALAAVRTIEKPTSLRIGGLFVSWLTLNNMQIWEPSFLTDHPMIKVLINNLPLFGIIWLGWFFANELINELRLIDSINS